MYFLRAGDTQGTEDYIFSKITESCPEKSLFVLIDV